MATDAKSKATTALEKLVGKVQSGEAKDPAAETKRFLKAFGKADAVAAMSTFDVTSDEESVHENLEAFLTEVQKTNSDIEAEGGVGQPDVDSPEVQSPPPPAAKPKEGKKTTGNRFGRYAHLPEEQRPKAPTREPARTDDEIKFEEANGKLYGWVSKTLHDYVKNSGQPLNYVDAMIYIDQLPVGTRHPRWDRYEPREKLWIARYNMANNDSLQVFTDDTTKLQTFKLKTSE
jgi:hypothetical protein